LERIDRFHQWWQLRANTIRHEADTSTQSHWDNYRDSQDLSQNNLSAGAEGQWAAGSLSSFISSVQSLLDGKITTIQQAAGVEPYGVNYNGSGQFQGYVNFYPYQSC
jgi:hypothetical protein